MMLKLAVFALCFTISVHSYLLKEKSVVDKWLNDEDFDGLDLKERFETLCRGNVDLIKSSTITRKQWIQWLDKCHPGAKNDEEYVELLTSERGINSALKNCKMFGGLVQTPSQEEVLKFLDHVSLNNTTFQLKGVPDVVISVRSEG
uniref:Uncharacterized protein n=1 Tax=Romanomermis culicivorax TaxID=13658 RepID=A0A915I4I5_ROMCU